MASLKRYTVNIESGGFTPDGSQQIINYVRGTLAATLNPANKADMRTAMSVMCTDPFALAAATSLAVNFAAGSVTTVDLRTVFKAPQWEVED